MILGDDVAILRCISQVMILLDVRMIGHYITVSMILMILRDGVTLGDDALVDRLMMLLYIALCCSYDDTPILGDDTVS